MSGAGAVAFADLVERVFTEFDGRYGATRIAGVLTERGTPTNKQAVARVLRARGLSARRLPLPRAELNTRVVSLFFAHDCAFGAERIAVVLARQGVAVSESTVANILRANGLRADR
ncbi:IS3 family transposase [Nocardia sp. NPDC058176]|uniref:IS3 family transposase n=1 Tax=Nocardia sp. NPDC058176 TaxID=3346368 RepID=UPI0036DE3AD7